MRDSFNMFFTRSFWSEITDSDSSTNAYRHLRHFISNHPHIPMGAFMMARSDESSLSPEKVTHLSADVGDMMDRMDSFYRALQTSDQFQLPDSWGIWASNGARRTFNGMNYLFCHCLGGDYEMQHQYAGVALDDVLANEEAMASLGSAPVWIFHGTDTRSVAYVNDTFTALAANAYSGSVGVQRDVFGSIQVGEREVVVTRSELEHALQHEGERVAQARQVSDSIDFIILLHVVGFAVVSFLLTGVMTFGLMDLPLTGNFDGNGTLADEVNVPWYVALGTVLDQQTSDMRTIALFLLALLSFKLAGHAVDEGNEDRVVILQNPGDVIGDPLNLDGPDAPQTSIGQIRALHGADVSPENASPHNRVKVGAVTSSITNNGRLDFRQQRALFSNHLTLATTRLEDVPDFIKHRSPNIIPVPDHLYVGQSTGLASNARRLIRALIVANTSVPISDRALLELPLALYNDESAFFDLGKRLWRLISHIDEFSWFSTHVLDKADVMLKTDDLAFISRRLDRSTDQLFAELHECYLRERSLLHVNLFAPTLFTHPGRTLSPIQQFKEEVFGDRSLVSIEWPELKQIVMAHPGNAFDHTAGRHGPKFVIQRLVDEHAENYLRFVGSLPEHEDVDGFIDLSKVDQPGAVSGFVFTGEDLDEIRAQGGDVEAAKAFGSGKTRLCMQANAYFQEKVDAAPGFIPIVKHVNGKYIHGVMSPENLEKFMQRANKVKENKPVKIGSYILMGAGAASLLVLGAYIRIPEECGDNDFCNTLTTNLVPEMFDFSGYLPGVIFQKTMLNPLNFATIVLGFGVYSRIRQYVGADIPPIDYTSLEAKSETVSGQLELEDRAALELLMTYNAQPQLFIHENLEALSEPSEASLSSVLTQALKTGRVRNMPVCMFIAASSNYLHKLKPEMISDVRQEGTLLQCTFSEYTRLLTEDDELRFFQTLLRMESELNIKLSPENISDYLAENQAGNHVRLNRDTLSRFAVSVRTRALADSPETDPLKVASQSSRREYSHHLRPMRRQRGDNGAVTVDID
jgi:hypothetical protein